MACYILLVQSITIISLSIKTLEGISLKKRNYNITIFIYMQRQNLSQIKLTIKGTEHKVKSNNT